ncbi:hypothetical protein Taro_012950 [Colocasia esculenta]|uniref:Uncharacterized protein n=1 Tax=Colocasia esculenta TaxID=4460 RepID=A0A843UHA3_COLES|nr:hypothetical protein [Colocasia esculenta]
METTSERDKPSRKRHPQTPRRAICQLNTHRKCRSLGILQANMETRRSANNRLTASQSIIRQTRPSWHHCQDTATKVSPLVTERREATSRVPYQKVLRVKPALGHTSTHKQGHGTPETHTGTVAALKAITMLSRRGGALPQQTLLRRVSTSRQEPCRDRQMCPDSPIAPGQHVATGTLS